MLSFSCMSTKTYIITISILSVILVSSIGFAIHKVVSDKIENDKCSYVIRIPYGKSCHTYYTNDYEVKDGILLFTSDGNQYQHKGNYTIGENK